MNLNDLKLILVPTDFSEASTLALNTAITMAQAFHAAIEVLHVDLDPTLILPPPADVISLPISMATMARSAEAFEQIVADVRAKGVACTMASESGRTHTTIVAHALHIGAGLIVMGSHGRHGLGHLLLGSVAEKVVENAPCAVLVIPVAPQKS